MRALSQEIFRTEEAAIKHLESFIGPNGIVCPHCGTIDRAGHLQGSKTPLGTWTCYSCRTKFTAKVGTIFEASHFRVYKRLHAAYLLASCKKSISARDVARTRESRDRYGTVQFGILTRSLVRSPLRSTEAESRHGCRPSRSQDYEPIRPAPKGRRSIRQGCSTVSV